VSSSADLYINGVIWLLSGIVTVVFSAGKDRASGALITLENPVPEQTSKRQRTFYLVLGRVQMGLGIANLVKGWAR
jgi:hypothetical protein